jgi:hypothetical protein
VSKSLKMRDTNTSSGKLLGRQASELCETHAGAGTDEAGYLAVSDIDGGDVNMISVTVGSGSPLNSTGNDFVDELGRTVTGVVLEDTDNDGDDPRKV